VLALVALLIAGTLIMGKVKEEKQAARTERFYYQTISKVY
jgi:hypothetical protein